MNIKSEFTKAHCNTCGPEKNHVVLFSHKKDWTDQIGDDNWSIGGSNHYDTIQCAGCDRITVRHREWFSEHTDEEGRPIESITYYPPAIFRRKPIWISEFDGFINISDKDFVPRLIDEIYTALHSSCRALAAMGIRALLEAMIIDCVDDHGSFGENLAAFENEGFVGSKQREILETTLDVGHAAIHRNYKPSEKDLILTLDITENIIQSTYVNAIHASKLKKRVPPRKKKASPKG